MYKIIFTLLLALAAGYFYFDFYSPNSRESNELAEDTSPLKEWKKFEPASGKFTVKLPSVPQYAIDVVNVPNTNIKRWYEIYVSQELDGTVYMINLITYHPDFDRTNVQELLHNVVNEIASSNLNNHVHEIKDITVDGRQALQFHIVNQDFQVEGQAFLVGATVYLLAYTSKKDNFNEAEFKTFVDSFELLKNDKTEAKPETKIEKPATDVAIPKVENPAEVPVEVKAEKPAEAEAAKS